MPLRRITATKVVAITRTTIAITARYFREIDDELLLEELEDAIEVAMTLVECVAVDCWAEVLGIEIEAVLEMDVAAEVVGELPIEEVEATEADVVGLP
jgi:hypothetical protein